jgi:D-sedoheptulose 7-phosphate isomerase
MNNIKYHQEYFKSIFKGLEKSIYYHNQQLVKAEFLLNNINIIFNELYIQKRTIYFLGNGASAAFANHMALDFSKNGKILARSLSDSAILTALSNDYSYEDAMLEYLKIEGVKKNDLVITISSSGNSQNIVSALEYCKKNDIQTLSLSGLNNNNKSILLSNYSIFVPMKTYGIVECIHQIFLHLLLDNFMNIFEWEKIETQNMNSKNFVI